MVTVDLVMDCLLLTFSLLDLRILPVLILYPLFPFFSISEFDVKFLILDPGTICCAFQSPRIFLTIFLCISQLVMVPAMFVGGTLGAGNSNFCPTWCEPDVNWIQCELELIMEKKEKWKYRHFWKDSALHLGMEIYTGKLLFFSVLHRICIAEVSKCQTTVWIWTQMESSPGLLL